jgi:N-acyl homoserine lactone hydrolase
MQYMTTIWKIKTLRLGEFTIDKSLETLNKDIGVTMKIPVLSTAVFSDAGKILIDTGVADPDWVNRDVAPFRQSNEERMEMALKSGLGWKPEEVDMVINTHLHHDHCANNMLFRNARFVIQRKEWRYAFDPLPIHSGIYMQNYFGKGAVNYFSWEHIEGEVEVMPGIKVFLTPGHTKGHQSVLVNTDAGPVCVAGDACNLVENIEEMIPPAITTSIEEALQSLQEIRMRAQYIIPGHDPCIKNFQTENFPQFK